MKISKHLTISVLVCGFFCILIPHANNFLIPKLSSNRKIQRFASEDEVEKRYLTSNFIAKALQVSGSSGSNIAGWIAADWPEFATLCKMAMLTPKCLFWQCGKKTFHLHVQNLKLPNLFLTPPTKTYQFMPWNITLICSKILNKFLSLLYSLLIP